MRDEIGDVLWGRGAGGLGRWYVSCAVVLCCRHLCEEAWDSVREVLGVLEVPALGSILV